MVGLARAGSSDARLGLYQALAARNRLVAILRIGLPALGVLVLLILSLQIYVGGLMRQFGISGVFVDRGNLVVETPSYSGAGADGTRYAVSASSALTSLANRDIIVLHDAVLSLSPPGGSSLTATAADAEIQTGALLLSVAGLTRVSGAGGLQGTLVGMTADLLHQSMQATGAVDLTFDGGTSITAVGMSYDGVAKLWAFSRAVVVIPETPGESP